ncbi:hypothetical protein RS030_152380 [Cryptosporidium xiaoi]|uniref:Palmitoyltransferase n=1 Tax=Cryptosporidium xiaoi TaxID=659607 RepID=A0AAV9Y112_9CRYT
MIINKVLRIAFKGFEFIAKTLGYFLILFVFFSISFLFMSGSLFIFPFMIKNQIILLFSRISLVFSTINLVYNYLLCLNTSPGYANSVTTHNYIDSDNTKIYDESFECTDIEIGTGGVAEHLNVYGTNNDFFQSDNERVGDRESNYLRDKDDESFIFDRNSYIELKECTKCGALKYPRTHHCSICNRCVLNMDHHCPWIGQCVGLHNRKYFILFLVWSFLSCLQISLFALPMMIILISALLGDMKSIDMTNSILSDNFTFQGLLLSAMLSISYSIGTGVLLFFHIYLLLTNQSTIEYHQNSSIKKILESQGKNWINKYDKGTFNNVREVMGTTKFPLILFPCL